MSVTRREFYLGTLLTAALTSAVLTAVVRRRRTHRAGDERLGDERLVLRLPWIWEAGPVGAFLFYFVIAMLFFVIGFWAATIYKRFGVDVAHGGAVGLGALFVARPLGGRSRGRVGRRSVTWFGR